MLQCSRAGPFTKIAIQAPSLMNLGPSLATHDTSHSVRRASPFGAVRAAEDGAQSSVSRERTESRAAPAAVVRFGAEARALAAQNEGEEDRSVGPRKEGPQPLGARRAEEHAAEKTREAGGELSEEEQREVREMKTRDAEVRRHEQAHKGAGGQYAGSIQLDVRRGPDGGSYAASGHVDIDVSAVKDDPAATIRKMAIVARSANAPADPSSADRSVAAKAAATAAQARAELAAQSLETPEGARGARAGAGPNEAHGVGHPADASEAQHAALEVAQQGGARKPFNLVA